jgi:hypothetical protein
MVLPKFCAAAFVCVLSMAFLAQQAPTSTPPTAPAIEKPKVFITDSESWEVSGSAGGNRNGFAAQSHGGARPQTAEIIKTFGQRCPQVVVNNRQELADFVVVLDHEGGKGYLRHRNKVAVFEYISGDIVVSHSTLSLGGSVEDACNGINQHWSSHSSEILAAKAKALAPPPAAAAAPVAVMPQTLPAAQASISVESTPAGADIEIDGAFVGNTPSTVNVTAGSHDVAVKKKGFSDWTKKLNVTGGSIHLSAELEAETPKQ